MIAGPEGVQSAGHYGLGRSSSKTETPPHVHLKSALQASPLKRTESQTFRLDDLRFKSDPF
jgi:hypothetical protein